MRRTDKLTAFVELANAAALPVIGKRGQAFELADDGTGKPAIAIWDSGASSWALISIGGGSGLAWQNPVEDKDIADPTPLTPSAGDRYIVAVGGAAAWAGKDDDIAEWDGVQWDFTTPTEGFACEVLDEDQFYAFTGTAWVILPDFLGAVSGTPPSVDNRIARYDGVTGLKVQNSSVAIDDNGNIDLAGASANITATQTIAIDDHYGIAELDAAPVAAGAKVDKIVGTDNALVKSDGVGGDVQDSNHVLADNGNLENTGTSATTKTSDKTGASNSVAVAHETGDVTGGGATGVSGGITYETGATVDGNSGDINQTTGIPTGTGTRGDANRTAKNITDTLAAPDDQYKIKSGVNDILSVEEDTVLTAALLKLISTVANPSAIADLDCQAGGNDVSYQFSEGGILQGLVGFLGAANFVVLRSSDATGADSSNLVIAASGEAVNGNTGGVAARSGDISAPGAGNTGLVSLESGEADSGDSGNAKFATGDSTTGDSGPISIKTGDAGNDSGDIAITVGTAGGTRGDATVSSPNWSVDAAGNILGNNLSGTNTGDEVAATEGVAGVAELATQAETDAGADDARIVTPLKLATTDVLDARYYTETESDANPVAAGAKIDKIVGTDHAAVRSDGITGDVQDSLLIIDDAGNVSATNLSGTNTGDEVAAAEGTAGIAELATQAETDAKTDDARIVTPLKLATTPLVADAIHDNIDGEIAAIAEKTSPASADLIVIEDSAVSNAKKRVQISNLAGCNIEWGESLGEDSHTGDVAWQDKVTVTATFVAGDYEIVGFAVMSMDAEDKFVGLRIDVDGSTQRAESTQTMAKKKQADGNYQDRSAIAIETLTAASHTIKLQYNTSDAAATVYIKSATLIVKKIG